MLNAEAKQEQTMSVRRQEYRQTARDIVSVFFVKKNILIWVFLGVVVGALMLSLLTPPVYESSVQLIVKPSNSKPLIFDQQESRVDVNNQVTEQSLNTVIFLLTSPDVLREVAISTKMATAEDGKALRESVDYLKSHIKAEPMTMSSVVKVTMKGGDPQIVTERLSTLVDTYIKFYIKVNQATEGRLEFFDEQAELFRLRYDQLTKQLASAGKQMGVIEPSVQKDNALLTLRDMDSSKTQLEIQHESLRGKLESIESSLAKMKQTGFFPGLPPEIVTTYPSIVEMERSLAQLTINLSRNESDYMPGSAPVRDAAAQISAIKTQIRKGLDQVVIDLRAQTVSNRRAASELQERMDMLRQDNVNLSAELLELDRLSLEHKLAKENFAMYSAKREEARINEEKNRARFANVTLVNRPEVPGGPSFPRPGMIMMLSIPLALVLALSLSATVYSMEQRLWTPTDMRLHTELKVLGAFDAVGVVEDTAFGDLWQALKRRTKAR